MDKMGLEYVARRSSTTFSTPASIPPIVPSTALSTIKPDFLPEVIIVQPALLVDGEPKGKYRAAEHGSGAYTIRRSDIGGFIAEQCASREEKQWVGKNVVVAY